MAESPVERLTDREPVEETSFEATEITDDEYRFTLKHPVDWINMTKT
jgi:hypothetical protein